MPGTIGKTSTGANSAETADNWANEAFVGASFRYTASAGESVTSIRTRGEGTGVCEVGVYVWNGSVPTTLVGSAQINVGASDGEYSTAVDWALTNGVTYVVGVDYTASIGALWTMHYDTGQGAGACSISANQGALEDPWAQSSTSQDVGTFWAVVEAEGDSAAITLDPFTTSASGTVELLPYVVTSNVAALTASDDPTVTFTGYTPQLNDLVILFVSATTAITVQANASLPSGWLNPLGDGVEVVSDSHGIAALYHFVTSGEVSAVTTTYTATNALTTTFTGRTHGVVVRNVNTTTPIDNFGTTFSSTNTATPHVLAGITGTGSALDDDSLVVGSVAADGTGTYGSVPTGWTQLQTAGTTQGRWTGYMDALTTANTNVAATNITPSAGDEYASISLAIAKVADVNRTGTAAITLASFTTSASGTVTDPPVDGTAAITLAPFTTTTSGTVTPPEITGTAAITLGSFVVYASEHTFPASISGKKVLDEAGNVFLSLTASSWRMAGRLTTAEATSALEGIAAAGFNGVTVWTGGSEDRGGAGQERYLDIDGNNFWSGTPWASSLGPAWAKVDHLVSECERLGLVYHFSFCAGFSTFGAGPDWEAATNTNMYDAGVAIATRYADAPNIVWHIMFDDAETPSSTRGQRIQALFDGINDTESPARPVRWCEVANGATTSEQGWYLNGHFNCSINSIYEYTASAVTAFEAEYTEESGPVGDCEPPYDGSPNAGSGHTDLRYRVASHFIEGGQLINWGHEDWWPFGAEGLFSEAIGWEDVPTHVSTLQAGIIFDLVRTYAADLTWAPTSSFIDNGSTGEGTGSTKAAQGSSDTAALACFPNSRTITVATTVLVSTSNVRLRWFDPSDGTFDLIAENEAQQTGRSVTHPGNTSNSVGAGDWILVVDEAPGDAQAAITLGSFTTTASGTSTPPSFTGTAAITLGSFTTTASGTSTPPGFTGTAAITLGSFTTTTTGQQGETGTAAITLGSFTTTASGTFTPPPITGTAAITLGSFTTTTTGQQGETGTAAITLAPFVTNGLGAFIPAGSGAAAITLAPFITTASGTVTAPSITGTAAITLGPFIANGQEGESTNITVVVGPPSFSTRTASVATRTRSATHAMHSHVAGVPDGVDRSVSHTMVAKDAGDPDTRDRSATIRTAHGSPDPPTL